MAKAKQAKEAPTTPEVVAVEGTQAETVEESNAEQSVEVIVEVAPHIEPTKFEKQLGVTAEMLSSGYSPSVNMKTQFAFIMETIQNYHMSCESKNDARYKDIMNHILTSCELATTFVK